MNFFEWYGTGFVIILAVFSWQAYSECKTIKAAASEVYDIFIRRADKLSTALLLIVALLGPLLLPAILYFEFCSWQDGLAIDDDGNRDYPWSKD